MTVEETVVRSAGVEDTSSKARVRNAVASAKDNVKSVPRKGQLAAAASVVGALVAVLVVRRRAAKARATRRWTPRFGR